MSAVFACVCLCAWALLHVHAACVSVCVLRFGLFLCPTFMIILRLPVCVCVCRLSVCSSHAVAVVVVAPLLAMTGDVDAMCTIHFGVSFVRSYLSVSVSFFLFRSLPSPYYFYAC